jgi:phosphoribosylformylglycinamidine cyclo-ligase
MSERIQDVNIELGDNISAMLYEASKMTHANRPELLVEFHESFSGLRAMRSSYFKNAGDVCFNLAFDGVGTKVEIAERTEDHSSVAHDLFAMVCDDAVVRGAEPVAIGSVLDVRHLNDNDFVRNAVSSLAEGYVEAASAAGVVVVNGEVAELGNRIGGYAQYNSSKFAFMYDLGALLSPRIADLLEQKRFNYNWGAAVLWFANEERLLSGHAIKPGDSLVGLAERGFRSNGHTDVRKILRREYGRGWHNTTIQELGGVSLGKLVQSPSIIYSRFICELTGGYDIQKEPRAEVHGIAHITGGGQPSKLGRMLEPSGLGANIDTPLEPPKVMTAVQALGGYSDKKAYGKWHTL